MKGAKEGLEPQEKRKTPTAMSRGVGQITAGRGTRKPAGGWVRLPLLGGSALDR